ncbi:MAG: cation:proton antiporter [Candidatus Woesearchaeota archaeon]
MEDFITLFLVIFLSYVFSLVFSKANLPKLVAPLLIGTFFGLGFLEKLFITPSVLTIITFVKDIAIIFLMFFVGLKIDFRHFVKSSRRSIYIAVFGSMIPFLLGFFGTLLAYHVGFLSSASFSGESLFVVAYVVGLCISVTAEVVLIEILQELKIIKSLTGETIIEAGLIDSLLGILLLSGLVAFLPSNSGQSESLLSIIGIRTLQIAIFGFLVFLLGKYFVPKIMKETVSQKERNINFFTIAIIIAFCLALISILLTFYKFIMESDAYGES